MSQIKYTVYVGTVVRANGSDSLIGTQSKDFTDREAAVKFATTIHEAEQNQRMEVFRRSFGFAAESFWLAGCFKSVVTSEQVM